MTILITFNVYHQINLSLNDKDFWRLISFSLLYWKYDDPRPRQISESNNYFIRSKILYIYLHFAFTLIGFGSMHYLYCTTKLRPAIHINPLIS
ncbi:hypothetical protein C2G38_594383 [Gigaspora rosea]|uniref:Uncharacterized protein n=1 Tax=Gigaspora rosea TaxID=44941 RepID=A0A397VU19_9GLOM|nr:hypothetical protein C2G38_594383 [Gigaspora rosea]